MIKLTQLCEVVREISDQGQLEIRGTSEKGLWVGSISVGGVVIANEKGDIPTVLDSLTYQVREMANRIQAVLGT